MDWSNWIYVFVLIVAVIVWYVFVRKTQWTYWLDGPDDFIERVTGILKTSNINVTHPLKEVKCPCKADINVHLVPREEMAKYGDDDPEYYPGTKKRIYFSWTYQSPKPTIYLDEVNWRQGVEESGLTVDQYQQYVIQHEMMHALGYDHVKCNKSTAPNGICPALYQSTRGCPKGFKCGYNVSAVDYSNPMSP